MSKPHCPICGYTKEDAAIHMDHHLCKGKIPGTKPRRGINLHPSPEVEYETGPMVEPGETLKGALVEVGAKPEPSRDDAALFLAKYSLVAKERILSNGEARDDAYRKAARVLHPDSGGSHDQFVQLRLMMAVLGKECANA